MSFHRWLDIIKDVEPGKTLPAGMSRRAIILDDLMVAVHEAWRTRTRITWRSFASIAAAAA